LRLHQVITRNHEKAEAYLYRLHREIEMQGELYDHDREVEQLHFGGGTPTFLTSLEIERLIDKLGQHFKLSQDPDREYSIELDPRTITTATLRDLARVGFNRCSLGIQDFDPAVQEAVNRIQSVPDTLRLIREARDFGFNSVSVDLIYGCRSSRRGFFEDARHRALGAAGSLRRLCLRAPAADLQAAEADQGRGPRDARDAPAAAATHDRASSRGGLRLYRHGSFRAARRRTRARTDNGSLQRNFQGYSTRGYCDLVGLGVSSIGKVGTNYMQNQKTLPEYYGAIDRGILPLHRGYTMTRDDIIRRDVIQQIMCYGVLDFDATAARHDIDFPQYFASELVNLEPLVADGLAEFAAPGLRVLPAGRLLLRHLGMAFDAYLPAAQAAGQRFSRAI
jgi:oxygen-independent coproporphyrinogen-3 oxidase